MRFPEAEYHLKFFDEFGYSRKRCPRCGEYFWTVNQSQELCGESSAEDCGEYSFINKPPSRRPYNLQEMREAFLSFFERKGHERIKPYPIVARWRDDLYFTNASIIDFQPYVTEGIIPPPANPLVISQPCVRFPDIDNVGPTFGRHLTIFEMGGHHAFNYPQKEVYWKDETIRYHHDFVTKELGVRSEEVVYKEGVWIGGGNAGPDVESIIGGLEVGTLVFMKYKVVNGEFVELPIRTVDTGYGIERFAWLSQGSLSCFHAIYGNLLEKITDMARIEVPNQRLLDEISRVSGLISISKTSSRNKNWTKIADRIGLDPKELHSVITPIVNVFTVTDHTKCLVFMLSEGVVPSNVQEGYLTRLILRRTYRLLRDLAIEEKMPEIIDMQIRLWSRDFPYLKETRNEILELLETEHAKYEQNLLRGRELVRRVVQEMKAKKSNQIPLEKLVELYDSHGLPPEVVCEIAVGEGAEVRVPENFYSAVAERHVEAPKTLKSAPAEAVDADIEKGFAHLPETSMLYYEDAYISDFKARVLRVSNNWVALDKTAFYPEGGGQLADKGFLEFNSARTEVVNVEKTGKVIVHLVKGPIPREGDEVTGIVNWERRISLMRHHTATHMVMGAARRVLGQHVWQAGAQKEVERARLDFSHPRRLTIDEINNIEQLANDAAMRNLSVETFWMPREEAEKKYGFRLYQGGVVPGREIRVVKTNNWEVEACGGTHCKTTGEVGPIKIIHSERIQDGVERLIFSAGLPAIKRIQEVEARVLKAAEILKVPAEKVENTLERTVNEWRQLRRDKENLMEVIAKFMTENYLAMAKPISGLEIVSCSFDAKDMNVGLLIKVANQIVVRNKKAIAVFICLSNDARMIIRVGEEARALGIDAREIAQEAGSELGGGGSGRPEFAQGGGYRVEGAPRALEKAETLIRKKLEGKIHVN